MVGIIYTVIMLQRLTFSEVLSYEYYFSKYCKKKPLA